MSTITDIALKVLSDANLGVPGEDLFAYRAPERVRSCILVIDSLDPVALDENLPGYKKGRFQVIVRNPDYKSGLTIAKRAASALNLSRLYVNGVEVKRMRAEYDPVAFPMPDSDVIETCVNMWIAFTEL